MTRHGLICIQENAGAHSQLEAVSMVAIDRFVSHVSRLAGLVRCACFEMAECDGMWPGEVAQPRKPPPDLGNQPLRCATITECQSTRDARTRDPFPLLANCTQDVIPSF
jgi:hypothetical protein